MDNKLNKILIVLLLNLGCHFSASAQNLDSWRMQNEPKIVQIEQSLKIRVSKDKLPSIQDRLRNIQKNIGSNLGQVSEQSHLNGGVDSGGGSIVLRQDGSPQLLDFFVHKSVQSRSGLESIQPIKIKSTSALNEWGIDRLDRLDRESTIYHAALDKLILKAETTSPFMSSLIRNAIFNLPIYVVDYDLGLKDKHYYLPKAQKNNDIREVVTGAVYFKNFGVFVSKKIFDKLNFEDQVGLLLHESLRHLQITHEYNFTDQELQTITTAIIQSYSKSPNLDSPQVLKGNLRRAYLADLNEKVQNLISEVNCLEGANSADQICVEQQYSDDAIIRAYKKEAELRVLKMSQFNYIDRIISDFQNHGRTQYKLEADLILEMLSANKVILRPETVP